MMAKVSELSIAQAQALGLQEEVKTKELLLEQCFARLEKGQVPQDEWENEWRRQELIDENLRNKVNRPMVIFYYIS